jgi:hypothetical protein
VFGYLVDFDEGWFAITNPRLGLGVGLRWPLEVFDKAWLWQEIHASSGWPWYRRAYVVAVEPASTIPGQGLVNAHARGQSGIVIPGGTTRRAVVEAVLFQPEGVVKAIRAGGRVDFG